MLYISRFVGLQKYGVVDTDDGVEEVCDMSDLFDAVCKHELDIAGIVPDRYWGSTGVNSALTRQFTERTISVYQPNDTMSQLQVKTKVLKKISVLIYNGVLVSLTWNPKELTEPVTLRLSDFSKSLGDCFLARNSFSGQHHVTLILDDSLEFTEYSFRRRHYGGLTESFSSIGVLFDMRELSDQVAEKIYASLYEECTSDNIYHIIDSDERKMAIMIKHQYDYLHF